MTAKGKVTTARLHEGSRIQVRLADGYPGIAYPTSNKVKDAHTFVVTWVEHAEATTLERRRTYNITGTIDGKTYTIPRATGAQTFWLSPIDRPAKQRGYVALYHAVSKRETMELHREGCSDIEKSREEHGSNLQAFEAPDLAAALDIVVDDELREMGYDHSSVHVLPCVTSTEPKEGRMTTATATRTRSTKPAPAPKEPTKRQRQAAATKARKDAAEKANASANGRKATAPKATTAKKETAPKDGVNFEAKAIRNRIVKEHEAGSTIKEIAEGLGLPAEHRSWFKVSKAWRTEADARGLKRPRRSK